MRSFAAIALALIALAAAAFWYLGASSSAPTPEGAHTAEAKPDRPAAAPAAPPPPAKSEPAPSSPDLSSALADNELESRAFEPRSAPLPLDDIDLPPGLARGSAGASAAPSSTPPPSLADQFKNRQVAYNRPSSPMALNRPVEVSLVINATGDADAADNALKGFTGDIVSRDVDLSDTVSAQLTSVGGGFDILSQTVERQRLSDRVVNRWQWRVTPTEPGRRTLILEIFGYRSGSPDAEPLDAYRDEIVVEVRQFDRLVAFARETQPIFAAIAGIAGAMSALIAFLRFSRGRKSV